MALLSVKDACISYGGSLLLDHINLNIERRERVCLLGRNGSGKTTLMKLINGEIYPDSGDVSRAQGVAIARLDQEAGFWPITITPAPCWPISPGTPPGTWPVWRVWASSWTPRTAGKSTARSIRS
jgi:ABC-type Mn2+/Zn2+ transport system ATPase subunit